MFPVPSRRTPLSALPLDYYERSSMFGYLHTVPDAALFFILLWTIGAASWPIKVAAALVIGIVAYRMTFILHDCSHGTLFASRAENEVVGRLTAALLVMSFPTYRRLHLLHHKHYRRAGDPQASDYHGLVPGRDHILRHLLAPLVFLMAWERVGVYFAWHHSGMSREERARPPDGRGTPREHAASAALIALAQAAVMAVSTHGLVFWPGYPMYLVSLSTIGLFLSRLRSYLEHGNLSEEDTERLVARTHLSNVFERHLLAPIWFNYHYEHHLWPQVPSRWLPRIYREVTANVLPPRDHSPNFVASLRQLARAARSRPTGG